MKTQIQMASQNLLRYGVQVRNIEREVTLAEEGIKDNNYEASMQCFDEANIIVNEMLFDLETERLPPHYNNLIILAREKVSALFKRIHSSNRFEEAAA